MPTPNIVAASTVIGPEFWLNAANAAVRRECGWHVAPVIEETLTLDGDGQRTLLLPTMRIVELIEVRNDGADVTSSVDPSRIGMLELTSGRWSTRLGKITVRMRHGFELDEVSDVAALIATLAKRAASTTTVASRSVNGAAETYLTAGGAPLSIPLLQIEKDTLAPFKIGWAA